MRTTLNIDDDLLIAVKEVARRESRSTGSVVSSMLRCCLTGSGSADTRPAAMQAAPEAEFGFRPFPRRGGIVTNALIDSLREEVGD